MRQWRIVRETLVRKKTVMEDRSNKIMESNSDEEIGCSKDQKLESAKGKMEEVREENERLKSLLSQLVKDYQSLQMHFLDILQQDQQQQGEDAIKATGTGTAENIEENEFVSLSLGMTISKAQPTMDEKKAEAEKLDKGLALGLDIIRFDPSLEASAETTNIIPSSESNSNGEGKEEEASAILPPSKALKTMRSGDNIEDPLKAQLKKARFSVRARCDTQTMNDGCQWRKYGQKMARGNPCPRAYYRCTVSPSCPVRKKVQRCAEDMSVLITTYEGTHNHPLPFSATAMASTTSAVASMPQSPSLSSQPTLAASDTAFIFNSTTGANNLHTLNFSSCSHISRPQQFCFPNSSFPTTNSRPTITLDLTAPPLTSFHNAKFASGFSNNSVPKFSSKSLNFASNFYPSQSSIPESCWNTHSGYFNYGTKTHNRNQSGSLLNSGKQPFQGNLHQPNYISNHTISQETISAAATKAVTVNSKFQSALAAALTTYLNNNGVTGGDGGENSGLKLKLGGDMYSSSPNAIGYASSSRYLNVSSSVANVAQQGKLVLSPSLPSPPASKSASGSLSDRSNQLLEYWKRRNSTTTLKQSNLSG